MKSPFKTLCLTLAAVPLTLGAASAQTKSKEDRQKIIENIVQADTNNDAAISRSEFETMITLNAADGLGRAANVKSTGAYGFAFGKLDSHGDGFLTQAETKALVEERKA
jgi:hypothetical protein